MSEEILLFLLVLVAGTVFYGVFFGIQQYKKETLRKEEEIKEHLEAEKLSKKMRDSRVEMGVRKPKTFSTKRKPQKVR
jgi:predicted Holliday junction resolvase-like endonuclease